MYYMNIKNHLKNLAQDAVVNVKNLCAGSVKPAYAKVSGSQIHSGNSDFVGLPQMNLDKFNNFVTHNIIYISVTKSLDVSRFY